MIKLERNRHKKHVISQFRGATPRNRLIALMKKARTKIQDGEPIKLDFASKWKGTKDQLLIETHNKCAYCESHMTVVSYGDVEHYRPKSVYWWLAYVYDNYLASCAICNQRFKGAQFEFTGTAMQGPLLTASTTDQELKDIAKTLIPDPLKTSMVAEYEAAHRRENPLIPNPYIDDPEPIFNWEVLDGIREVEVVPNPAFDGSDKIVDACERIYGLNRPKLKRLRYDRYEIYNTLFMSLSDLPDNAPSKPFVEKLVSSFQQPDNPYAAMIRHVHANRA